VITQSGVYEFQAYDDVTTQDSDIFQISLDPSLTNGTVTVNVTRARHLKRVDLAPATFAGTATLATLNLSGDLGGNPSAPYYETIAATQLTGPVSVGGNVRQVLAPCVGATLVVGGNLAYDLTGTNYALTVHGNLLGQVSGTHFSLTVDGPGALQPDGVTHAHTGNIIAAATGPLFAVGLR
jgi:hypothetical protein